MNRISNQVALPPGAVTGIGSLPLCDPGMAVQFVSVTCPEIPFWPQLPQRSPHEGMIAQPLGMLASLLVQRDEGWGYVAAPSQVDSLLDGLQHAPAGLDRARAAGFFAFEAALEAGLFHDAVALKGQTTGPLTLASLLFVDDTPLLALPSLLDATGHYVARIARWQAERLRRWHKPVLLFLDEPLLGMLPPGCDEQAALAVLSRTVQAVRAAGVLVGLHSCATSAADVPTAEMCRVCPDMVSFDAYQGMESFFAHQEAQAFVQAGGRVAAGLVPTWNDLSGVDATALFNRWQQAAAQGGELAVLAHQTLITASCGLGLLSEDAAWASFALAQDVGQQVRNLAAALPS